MYIYNSKSYNMSIINTEQCAGIAIEQPEELWVVTAYCGGCTLYIDSFNTRREALMLLNTIYEALKDGKPVLDLGEINHG